MAEVTQSVHNRPSQALKLAQEGITMAARTQLTNARLFDSIAGSISERSAILINGARIESVATGETRTPEGAEVVDLGGQTVVPGLIDTHVHYALGGDEAMKLFIANGATSVRDCGGQLELLKARSACDLVGREDWTAPVHLWSSAAGQRAGIAGAV